MTIIKKKMMIATPKMNNGKRKARRKVFLVPFQLFPIRLGRSTSIFELGLDTLNHLLQTDLRIYQRVGYINQKIKGYIHKSNQNDKALHGIKIVRDQRLPGI